MLSENITIFGDGKATRDFVYVDDLCNGLIAGLNCEMVGANTYHLASGVGTPIGELATDIVGLVPNTRATILHEPARAGEVIYNFADYGKAKENSGLSRAYHSRAASKQLSSGLKA